MSTRPLAGLLAALITLAPATPALAQSAPTRAPVRDTAAPARPDFISDTGQLHVAVTRTGNMETITRLDGSMVVRTIADTTGDGTVYDGCQTYYPADAVVNLATAAKDDDCWSWDKDDPARLRKTDPNGVDMSFLGWNQEADPRADVTNSDQEQAAHITTRITMPAHAVTVYAVWASRPVLNYDMNVPDGATVWDDVDVPGSISADYNTSVEDTSGWKPDSTGKVKGYKFKGWYDAPGADGEPFGWRQPGDTEGGTGTPLTQAVTTVYAHWERLGNWIAYDPNGGQGSHKDTDGYAYSTIASAKDLNDPDREDAFHRTGYRLGETWNTCPDPANPKPGETCVAYKPGDGVPVLDQPVTLYAQWTPLLAILPTAGGTGLGPVPWPVVIGLGAAGLVAAIAGVTVMRRRMADAPKHGR